MGGNFEVGILEFFEGLFWKKSVDLLWWIENLLLIGGNILDDLFLF